MPISRESLRAAESFLKTTEEVLPMILSVIELVLATLLLGIHFRIKKDITLACNFAAKFLIIWYWATAVILFFIGPVLMGLSVFAGTLAAYVASTKSVTPALMKIMGDSLTMIALLVFFTIQTVMCILGAHMLKSGTVVSLHYDRIAVGSALILVATAANFFI